MHRVEISDELYDRIMKRDKTSSMPFEANVWELINREAKLDDMMKDTMKMVIGAAIGKTPEQMDEIEREREKYQTKRDLLNGKIKP